MTTSYNLQQSLCRVIFFYFLQKSGMDNLSSQIRDSLVLSEGQRLDENLLCAICQELVVEPQECEDCQNLFCKACIESWKKKNDLLEQCPFKCPSKPIKLKNPHRFVRNALSALTFKCKNAGQGCQEILTMDQIDGHAMACQFAEVKCENGNCRFISIRKDLIDHRLQCPYQILSCEKCFIEYMRKDKNSHRCESALIKQVQELKEDNQKLRHFIEQYMNQTNKKLQEQEQRISSLENQVKNGGGGGGTKGPQCLQGHALTWTRGNWGNCYQCKTLNTCVRYICQTCKVGFCQQCKVPVVVNNKCPANHPLQHQTMNISNGISCDFCGKRPTVMGVSNYRDDICDFDICQNCFTTKVQK